MDSDNPEGAENQQERLIRVGWVIGFVDGEGCFSIGLHPTTRSGGAKRLQNRLSGSHEFAVTQGAKSVACLHELHEFFGVGNVYANRRYDNHKEHLYRFVVRKRQDLLRTVIPFFQRNPMRSSKQADFEKFASCVKRVDRGWHLSTSGLAEIAEIAQTMNRQKPRHDLIRILRGHTPNTRDTG